MARSLRALGVLACLFLATAGAASAAPAAFAAATSAAPAAFAAPLAPPPLPRAARVLGALAGATPLHLTVALTPRDPAGLAAYAAAVNDPASPDYRRYLSVSAFAARFGPSPAATAAVAAALRARGLHPGPVSANGLALGVRTTAAAVAHALGTLFERVSIAGRTAFRNTAAPSLPSAVRGDVQGILGLDDVAVARPLGLARPSRPSSSGVLGPGLPAAHAASAHTAGAPAPCGPATTAAAGNNAYTADQIASAYSFDPLYSAGDLGAGQTVAVYELESNFDSDIKAFESCYQISPTVIYQQVDGGGGILNPLNHDGLETALDVENLIGLAPQAKVIVYQGPNTGNGPYDTYSAIVSGNLARVITTSWGQCEPEEGSAAAQAENTLFQEAAVQGQTVVSASGDSGTQDCYAPPGSTNTSPAVDDPASQPYVTGVGGTSLPSLTRSQAEVAWNDAPGASGGGDSTLWSMPSYQSTASPTLGVINPSSSATPCAAASGDCRQVPDVSADADPLTGYVVEYGGGWTAEGGTSAAAPLWAALFALADASSACSSGPIGFANPVLYGAAATSAYGTMFNDIVFGNNDLLGTASGQFMARPGYDQVTGLGSPVASTLVPDLCGGPINLNGPGTQTSVLGTSTSLQLSAAAGSGTITYGASGLPPGLALNPANGLISGTPVSAGASAVTISATTATQSVSSAFTWNIVPASVTLAPVATQRGALGQPASVQLSARADNGSPITYRASGLPVGLALNSQTGTISGTPLAAGTANVTASATASGTTTAVTGFQWVIVGPPGITRVSLRGIRAGKPSLQLTFSAGIDAASLAQVSFALPSGLSFVKAKLRKGLSLGGQQFTSSLSGGRLTVSLRAHTGTLALKLASPALRSSKRLRRSVKAHPYKQLTFRVQVIDAAGTPTTVPLAVKAS